jgi:hypothetical protein
VFTAQFWKETAERAVKTAAQSALLVIGADQMNALTADWGDVAGFASGGAILSVLTSLASSKWGPPDSPSLVKVAQQ